MLKRVLIATALMMSIPIVVGFFLPRDYEAQATRTMPKVSPDTVYAQLADLRAWEQWSVWNRETHPDCEWTYEGEPGEGMRMNFNGPRLGKGTIVISTADPATGIEFSTKIPGEEAIQSRISLAATDGGVEVSWWSSAKVRSDPVSRWGAFLMFESAMQGLYEQNLKLLEAHLEKQAKAEPAKDPAKGGDGEGKGPDKAPDNAPGKTPGKGPDKGN